MTAKFNKWLMASAMAICGPAFTGAALAQGSGGVDEIYVTALKRTQNLQDVPLSVSAITGDDLAKAGAFRLEDATNFVPNVFFNPGSSIRSTEITIRGIKSEANNLGFEQAVGVYIDGVYMGRPTTINGVMYDLERVEVLRGPQGTLYGKNTIAGAINLVSKLPGDEFEGDVSFSYGNYNHINARGGVSGPIIDGKLSMRLAGQTEQRDGFLKNLAGPDNNDADTVGGRLTLLFTPTDNIKFIVRGDLSRDRTNNGGTELATVSPLLSQSPFNVVPGSAYYTPDDPYDYRIADAPSSFQNRDMWGVSGELSATVFGGELTSITAWRGHEWENFQSADKSPFDILGTGVVEDQEQFSQELRFASPIGEHFDYILGAYYFWQNLEGQATAATGPDFLAAVSGGASPLGSFFTSESALLPTIKTESVAAYAQGTLHATNRLDITAGVRWTDENKDMYFSVDPDFVVVMPILDGNGNVIEQRRGNVSDSVVTPSASISYKATDDALIYFSFGRGFKAGGFNAFDFDFQNSDGTEPDFRPEFVNSYELGAKTSWWDNKLQLNASLFFMDYTDLQVNRSIVTSQDLIVVKTTNAAKAENKGVELELLAQPNDHLELKASYGYTDATYKDFILNEATAVDVSGNRLTSAPRHTAGFSFLYENMLTDALSWSLRGEYSYRAAYFSDVENIAAFENNGRSIVNCRLGIATASKNAEISLWVRNLFKEEYSLGRAALSSSFAPGGVAYIVGDPRTYGVELRYSF